MDQKKVGLFGGLIAVLVVVTVLLLVSGSMPPPGEAEDPSRRTHDEFTDRAPTPPGTASDAPAARVVVAKPDSPRTGVTTGRRLIGVLTNFDPELPGEAVLEVRGIAFAAGPGPDPIRATATGDGRFDLDVGRLLAGEPAPSELDIRVNHPAYLPARHRVPTDEEARSRVEIPLRPAAILLGRVLDSGGGPVVGATVSVHEIRADGVDEHPTDIAVAGADGSYRLRAMPARGRLLIVAWSVDLAPDARVIASSSAIESSVEDLVLPAGSAISGRVISSGHGVAGAGLRVGPYPEAGCLSVNDARLVWDGKRVRKGWCRAETTADGAFRLTGLAEGAHQVTVEDVPGVRMHSGFANHLRREVAAPAEDVEFDVTGARVVLRVQSGDETFDDFAFFLEGGDGVTSRGGRKGKSVTLLLAPGATHSLQVFRRGYRAERVTVVAPAKGGEIDLTVPLVVKRPGPTLVLTLRVEEGAPAIDRVGIGGYHPRTERGPVPSWFKDATRSESDGRFRFKEVPAGRWVVIARPGTRWNEPPGHFLFAAAEVVLTDGEEVEVALDAKLGGRLRIAARNPDGAFLNAGCRVLAADGRALAVVFLAQDQSGTTFGNGTLAGRVPNEVDQPLPPGTYRVEFEMEDRHPKAMTVVVNRGETTEVNVVLEKR